MSDKSATVISDDEETPVMTKSDRRKKKVLEVCKIMIQDYKDNRKFFKKAFDDSKVYGSFGKMVDFMENDNENNPSLDMMEKFMMGKIKSYLKRRKKFVMSEDTTTKKPEKSDKVKILEEVIILDGDSEDCPAAVPKTDSRKLPKVCDSTLKSKKEQSASCPDTSKVDENENRKKSLRRNSTNPSKPSSSKTVEKVPEKRSLRSRNVSTSSLKEKASSKPTDSTSEIIELPDISEVKQVSSSPQKSSEKEDQNLQQKSQVLHQKPQNSPPNDSPQISQLEAQIRSSENKSRQNELVAESKPVEVIQKNKISKYFKPAPRFAPQNQNKIVKTNNVPAKQSETTQPSSSEEIVATNQINETANKESDCSLSMVSNDSGVGILPSRSLSTCSIPLKRKTTTDDQESCLTPDSCVAQIAKKIKIEPTVNSVVDYDSDASTVNGNVSEEETDFDGLLNMLETFDPNALVKNPTAINVNEDKEMYDEDDIDYDYVPEIEPYDVPHDKIPKDLIKIEKDK